MAGVVRISTGAPWEPVAGYSRAVKAGDWVVVSGTTATDERGALVGIGQMYVQARQAIANIGAALSRVGLGLRDVVRTRMFVTDISRFDQVARAHCEAFGEAPPATTMVEVRRLVNPDMLIEIEADAFGAASERQASAPPPRMRAPKAKAAAPKSRPMKKPARRKLARRR
jgi:enamine deaminase RidA (YjgF/YER057c/UK114 family)